MTILGYIQLGVEVMAFITAVIFYKGLIACRWLLWIPFLLYTCVVEITGAYFETVSANDKNYWLYNPYIIVSSTFYAWFLVHNAVMPRKTKRILYFFLFLLSMGSSIWYVLAGDPTDLISFVLNIGAFIICILCLLFFYTHIKNPSQYKSLTDVPAFWMVAGILLFYTGISIYVAIYKSLADANIKIWGTSIQNFIPQVLSLFLYTAIIAAFIKCHRITKYRLS